jgi:putative ABC transport system permease protein
MIKKITSSFLLALHNIRSNFFHTLLSILGIVIGVAALVIILSLIDGMEEFAKAQISSTTNLKAITIQSEPFRKVNEVRVRKDTFSVWNYESFVSMSNAFSSKGNAYLISTLSREIHCADSIVGAMVNRVSPSVLNRLYLSAGKLFDDKEAVVSGHQVVINNRMASVFYADSLKWNSLLGDSLSFEGKKYAICGVVSNASKTPEIYLPIASATASDLVAYPPLFIFEANDVEHVADLKKEIQEWLAQNIGSPNDFVIVTNEFRVEQAAKGFFLFRVIMGLIVGVSVLVGGIGVMNVLLISVTERTSEIGVRKAVGANRRDIVMQFLAESITVSVFGSLTGLVLGILTTLAIVPIVKMMVDVPFQAAYTWNTFFVVSGIAIVIGIVFGTYPALRASRLDPVEAIRRE